MGKFETCTAHGWVEPCPQCECATLRAQLAAAEERAERAERERDNLRHNYGQALADADHHKQESATSHAAFIVAFDRATAAESRLAEAEGLLRESAAWLYTAGFAADQRLRIEAFIGGGK